MSFALVARKPDSAAAAQKAQWSGKNLRVSQPQDALEKEADRVADAVMRGSRAPRWSGSKVASGTELHRQPTGAPQPSPVSGQSADPGNILGKLADAFLQTDVGKKLKDAITSDPVVKGLAGFADTLPGKVIAGTAAAATVSALAAAHQPLPAQIPAIPLDFLKPGLSVKLDYEGPVDKPTKAAITFSFTPKGDAKKPPSTGAASGPGTGPADSWDPTRNMKYKPGSPQDLEQQQQRRMIEQYELNKAMQIPGAPGAAGGAPQFPSLGQSGSGTGLKMPEWQNPFAPKAPALFDRQLELKPISSEPDAAKKKEEPAAVQRKAAACGNDAVAVPAADVLPRSAGRPLDIHTRMFMESRFGFDFSKVRVHADGEASAAAGGVNALAYTVGNDIVFGVGSYSPETREGRRLLAHELAHTVQQAHGLSRTMPHPTRVPGPGPRVATGFHPAEQYGGRLKQIRQTFGG